MTKDHNGTEYPSRTAMCRAYGIQPGTFDDRVSKGWTLEQALTTPKGQSVTPRRAKGCMPVTDHKGRQYPSVAAMCRDWGILSQTYLDRRLRGWDMKQALETPCGDVDTAPKQCTDHLGTPFPDIGTMCAAHGIPRSTYYYRILHGWDLKSALTFPPSQTQTKDRSKPCKGPAGEPYPSIKAMCAAYGVRYGTFTARLKRGESLAQALGAMPATPVP